MVSPSSQKMGTLFSFIEHVIPPIKSRVSVLALTFSEQYPIHITQ